MSFPFWGFDPPKPLRFPSLCAINFKLYSNTPYDSEVNLTKTKSLAVSLTLGKPNSQNRNDVSLLLKKLTHCQSQANLKAKQLIANGIFTVLKLNIWFIPSDMSLRDSSENNDSESVMKWTSSVALGMIIVLAIRIGVQLFKWISLVMQSQIVAFRESEWFLRLDLPRTGTFARDCLDSNLKRSSCCAILRTLFFFPSTLVT